MKVVNPPLSYIRQQNVDRFAIALAVEIPYPLLQLWYSIVDQKNDQGNSSDYLDLLNRWIPNRWFQVSRETGFRIHGRLRREASSVVSKYKKATGGRKKQQLNDCVFTLSILVSEIVSVGRMEENLRQANLALEEWRETCEDLQKDKESLLKEMAETTRRKDAEKASLNKELSEYIQKIADLNEATLPNYGKKIDQLGERQRSRKIKELKGRAELALWFLESYGLKLTCLKVMESDSGRSCTFDYQKEEVTQEDDENLEQLLFLLDKFCVSDELYHELTILYNDLPRSYLIKQKRSDLNKLCHIEKVPGNYPGAQISFVDTLQDHIRGFFKTHPNHPLEEPIKVKISGDGAKMSRTTNFMILSFALLQTGEKVMSSKGNRTLCIVNGPEKYDTLKSSMGSVINEINSVIKNGKLEVDGKEVPIEMFLGGDYKFLLMTTGLKGATSDYACLWCKIHRLQRWDMSKDLDFYNTGELKRTLQEIRHFQSSNKFCCIHPPLFDIELDHVVLDELHLMMRITDRLTENIITEVMERDSKADFLKKRGEEKGVHLKRLISIINNLGITFSVWEKTNADGKGSGTYDWTSLIGSDKKKLLSLLPSQLESRDILFPETKETVVKIWRDFESLYQMINSAPDENENNFLDVSEKSKELIELFCSLGGTRVGYNKARVTPYMHALSYHVPIFIKNYQSFKQFTGQGVEKNNDDAKRIFFQKSNKWDAARDVLQLEARQQALNDHEREKRKYDKQNNEYWGSGIVESRKKRMHSRVSASESQSEASAIDTTEVTRANYEKMTIKQLTQEIKSRNLQVSGISKLKKGQLIDVLMNTE